MGMLKRNMQRVEGELKEMGATPAKKDGGKGKWGSVGKVAMAAAAATAFAAAAGGGGGGGGEGAGGGVTMARRASGGGADDLVVVQDRQGDGEAAGVSSDEEVQQLRAALKAAAHKVQVLQPMAALNEKLVKKLQVLERKNGLSRTS
ncbi:hypothetical protein CLOP_g22937 [Closterium sp. NIES-67]|nr:hypothetical protein CLOP_g22937 [Closterium sp. NIES-67]